MQRISRPSWMRVSCIALAVILPAACSGDSPSSPPPPPLVLSLPSHVEGRAVTCTQCGDPAITVIVVVPVTIQNPDGAGTLASVETRVVNRSRFMELARNVRPNKDFSYPDRHVPAAGTLVVEAGAGFGLPPPRDEIVATVIVRLTDGREAAASAQVAIVF